MTLTAKRALQIILAVGLLGMVFSGVLTYREFTGPSAAGCSALGAPGTVFGYPSCVYGLLMYLVIVLVAAAGLLAGLQSEGKRPTP